MANLHLEGQESQEQIEGLPGLKTLDLDELPSLEGQRVRNYQKAFFIIKKTIIAQAINKSILGPWLLRGKFNVETMNESYYEILINTNTINRFYAEKRIYDKYGVQQLKSYKDEEEEFPETEFKLYAFLYQKNATKPIDLVYKYLHARGLGLTSLIYSTEDYDYAKERYTDCEKSKRVLIPEITSDIFNSIWKKVFDDELTIYNNLKLFNNFTKLANTKEATDKLTIALSQAAALKIKVAAYNNNGFFYRLQHTNHTEEFNKLSTTIDKLQKFLINKPDCLTFIKEHKLTKENYDLVNSVLTSLVEKFRREDFM
jgi:hypothetical protein